MSQVVARLSYTWLRPNEWRVVARNNGGAHGFDPDGLRIPSLASGKCLDLPGGQTKDGTPAIQYDCMTATVAQISNGPSNM
jgi:hypothetical protein